MAEHELPNACATLKDLCARDKTKVSKLIKQVSACDRQCIRATVTRSVVQVVELKHERTDLQQALHAVSSASRIW